MDYERVDEDNLTEWEAHVLNENGLHLDEGLSETVVVKMRLLPVKRNTLRTSRSTGRLGGVPAPVYRKVANHVEYTPRLIFEWLRRNTKLQSHG